MPSIKRLFFFNKKKGHGSKFHEYHGYDNLRQTAYHQTTPSSYHQQPPPPPHSFSHRQHLYPQQLIMQPPHPQPQVQPMQQPPHQSLQAQTQVIASATGHCQCHQCSFQQSQQQQQHQNHQQTGQHQHDHQQTLNPAHNVSAHIQIYSPQPQVPVPMQTLSPPQPTQQPHQHQQLQQHQQPFHYHSSTTTATQQFISQPTTTATNIVPQVQSATTVPQCACQTCPFNQAQQQIQQQPQPIQHVDILQPTLGACQNQVLNNGLNGGHQQCQTYNHIPQPSAPVCLSYTQNQNQQQQQHPQQHPQQPFQCQEQATTDRLQSQQYQYHTIQPHQFQLQKQQLQQQQPQHQQNQHHRVQSLHQQVTHNAQHFQHSHQQFLNQPFAQSQSQLLQQQQSRHQEDQQQQVESRSHDFSRYANMQSLMNESQQSIRKANNSNQSKFQEHVYCNQKPELTLPPYEPPPDYDTFLERRKMYSVEMSFGKVSPQSSHEPLVLQRTKDSSYENLRTRFSPYSNLGICRQELGYTS